MKVRDGQGEIKFSQTQIENIERVAKGRSDEDYLLLQLWGRRGLRVSESIGITRADVRDKGVWITQKGGERVLKILPPELYDALSNYSTKIKTGRIFPITRQTAYNRSQSIAREAGLDNWQRVHPHRWRHFFRDLPSPSNRKGPVESKEPNGPQRPPRLSSLRRKLEPRRGAGGIVKIDAQPRRFWILGVAALALLYHSYGILSGVYQDLTIVTSDQAVVIGVLEVFVSIILIPPFLWKTIVWQHDRPKRFKHVFDDPNILD